MKKQHSELLQKVAIEASKKYKCNWTAKSFDQIENCESWENVSGFEECKHVFFSKTKGQVYITTGISGERVGVEYIHHKSHSQFKNKKGSHSYCDF